METEFQSPINELDLSFLDGWAYKEALECFEKKDAMGILTSFSNDLGLNFVIRNVDPLLKQGIYEETLFCAYTDCRINWCHISPSWMDHLFSLAKRDRLLEMGDPLPHSGPFIIYRGVAGVGAKRRKRGISWTASFEKAKWFATRLSEFFEIPLEKPMVYMAEVPKEKVYVYTNERDEQEFLCNIPKDLKLKKVWP